MANLVDRMVYCAETAERKYQENLRAKGPDIKLGNDHELAKYIEGKIYKYINDGVFLRVTNKSLPMGGKRKTEYKKVQAAEGAEGDGLHRDNRGRYATDPTVGK